MSDIEDVKAFFDRFHINHYEWDINSDHTIRLHTDEGKGYLGFYLEMNFTREGKFINYAVLE